MPIIFEFRLSCVSLWLLNVENQTEEKLSIRTQSRPNSAYPKARLGVLWAFIKIRVSGDRAVCGSLSSSCATYFYYLKQWLDLSVSGDKLCIHISSYTVHRSVLTMKLCAESLSGEEYKTMKVSGRVWHDCS